MKVIAFYKPIEGIQEIATEAGIEVYEEPPDSSADGLNDAELLVVIHASQCPDGVPHTLANQSNDYECMAACVAAMCGETAGAVKYPRHSDWFRHHVGRIRGVAVTSGSGSYDYKKVESAKLKLISSNLGAVLDVVPKRVLGELVKTDRLLDYLRGHDSLELALQALLALLAVNVNDGRAASSTDKGAVAGTDLSFEDFIRNRATAYREGSHTLPWDIGAHHYSVTLLSKRVGEAAAKAQRETRAQWLLDADGEIPDSLDSAIRLIASPTIDIKVWNQRLKTLRDILLPQ